MSSFRLSALIGLALLCSGVALSAEAQAPSAAASSEVPEGFSLEPDGTTLRHDASGLRFPIEFDGFKRLNERTYDPSGEYVAIGYDRPLGSGKGRIVVRMAVVHIDGMPARDHYMIMRQAAMAHFAAPSIVSEGRARIPHNRRLDAYRGTFSGYRDNQPWLFSLTTVNYGYWSGRMTAAFPASQSAEAEKHLGVLLGEVRAQKPRAPKDK
ncbi:MAG: hypothetical protein K0R64_3183 [Novosphingobium lindaniclasticum]|jgi:hypothetical protein|uniref:hypothetical protein n=1 Tax=Novosphingobium lindaniclasticum TaxID=1329895 RepID=UPI0024090240|nr:hypothetical protein [Novosphingobium lindaniclasticum]MDF2640199.1 hypothetical protein [Novosphingobium lindaniclasticum]